MQVIEKVKVVPEGYLFKIKSYICICNIKLNAYGNIC